jgi:hypothetical protein
VVLPKLVYDECSKRGFKPLSEKIPIRPERDMAQLWHRQNGELREVVKIGPKEQPKGRHRLIRSQPDVPNAIAYTTITIVPTIWVGVVVMVVLPRNPRYR